MNNEFPNHAPLLERHIEACLADVPRWMAALANDTRQALQSPSTTRSLRSAGGVPMQAAEVGLARDQLLWVRRTAELLVQRWQDELAPRAARDAGSGRLSHSAFDSLALVDEAEAEENIELVKVVQSVELEHELVLRELAARSATLRGEGGVKRGSNLLRADLMVRAVWDATETLGLAPGARLALLRAAAVPLSRALGRAYADALERLKRWGVTPAAWRATALPGRRLPTPEPSGFDVTRPGALDMLRGRMQPQVPIGTPGAPDGLPDAMLTRVLGTSGSAPADPLANRLLERLPLLEAAARQVIERQVIELIARMVDAVLHDEQLRLPVRSAIAKLQVPLLRLALQEPKLFDDHRHPAWTFLNRLGSWTLGYDDDGDPRLSALMRSVDDLCARLEVAPTIGGDTFVQALRDLEFIFETDLSAECDAVQDSIARLQRAERRGEMKIGIRRAVQTRLHAAAPEFGLHHHSVLGAGLRLSDSLKRFLVGPWVDAIAEAALRDGEDSSRVQAFHGWVDELLRSLEVPRTPEERQRLLRLVPTLVQRLQQGLALTKLTPDERQAVLDELADRHMQLLRPDARSAGAPAEALTPAELVRRMREEDDDAALAASATPERAAQDSLLDFGTLHTVPAELLDGADAVAPRDWVRHLALGAWCRLVPRGSWTVARLLWISDSREHLLFSDADPGLTHALTRAAFERLVAEQLAAPLEERSLLERAVDALVSQPR